MKKENSRRKFVRNGVLFGLGLPLSSTILTACLTGNKEKKEAQDETSKKLKILILGGTSFLGPHQIAYALSRGHQVSTFTRGKTEPTIHVELFDKVEQLIGDRENDLTALENGQWDLVIDNSGRNVEWTKKSAELLKDRASLYLYTSSTGVYYPYMNENFKEDTEVLMTEPENIEDEDEKIEYWYGVMKANSEQEAIKAFGKDRSIIVRPTYMVGPGDKTDRFIYWPVRLAKGGEVMVPGKTTDPVQYIDVRDVAEWMIRLAEEKITGTFNAVGPEKPQSMMEFVEEASTAFEAESTLVQIDDYEFLKANQVLYLVPWIMPEGKNYGSSRVDNEKAIRNGLTFRPLKETVGEIYDWWESLPEERRNQFEEKPDSVLMRETDILEKWALYK
ncbi:NAD-dependent epimerase/dehydratase family protein [Robertkochia solimangrovi]|uniref:NAD-dependent epimerase/dehydratase family protein n=1 Tax=Robertkochia solimangrovi TaxID=2213046 RepID=UPI00117DDA70|nr:NAD-dependent epimerase/dehydratase family protein [Robertkochia solimangrovi]TRZ42418.1 hypothetical protein DMZ48_12955 [Robertkochia solimangrovi]